MGDLPHVNAGYIQTEETQFQQSVDTGVYSKMGEDLNFIKDEADTALADAAILFSSSHQAISTTVGGTTDASGNYANKILDLGGKKIRIALVALRFSSGAFGTFAPAVALQFTTSGRKTLFDTFGKNYNQYTGVLGAVPPYLQVNVQNAPSYDQVYAILNAGSNPVGPSSYLPPNTGFTMYISAIYATS